jgi:hypothetical protein
VLFVAPWSDDPTITEADVALNSFLCFNYNCCIQVLGKEIAYLPVHAGGSGEDERRVDDCAIAEPPNLVVWPKSCYTSYVRGVHGHIFGSRYAACGEGLI